MDLLLTQKEFREIHERFFGKGSAGCSEVDDDDICFVVAKAQLQKVMDKQPQREEQVRIAERAYVLGVIGQAAQQKASSDVVIPADVWDKLWESLRETP